MCTKISSNTLNIDSNSLYQPVTPQFTEAGTLMNEGNFRSANSQIENIPLAMPILNTLGGVLGAGYGLHLSKKGVEQTYTALECSDRHGVVSGAMNTGVGVTFVGASAAMGANGVIGFLEALGFATAKTAEVCIDLFTTAINWLGLTLYSFYIGGAVASLPELHDFRSEFQTMMKNPRMSAKIKALEGLYFLKNKITLMDQEKASLSPELVIKAEQKNWNQFIRFVGLQCAEKVKRDLPQLLREVQEGKLDNAQKLLNEVNRGNFKQIVGQIAMLVAGILGSIGSVLAITAVGGYAAFALFASSSALYWLNSGIGDIAYKIIAPSTDITQIHFRPAPA